jgi:hypothetical protein
MSRLSKALKNPVISVVISPEEITVEPERIRFPLPPHAFGDGPSMAACLSEWLNQYYKPAKLEVSIGINTRNTLLRLTPVPEIPFPTDAGFTKIQQLLIPSDSSNEEPIPLEAVQASILQSFPFSDEFNESNHVIHYGVFRAPAGPDILFIAALPLEIANALVKMCQLLGISLYNIKRIEPIEYTLLNKHITHSVSICLCLRQENGVRLLFAANGIPTGIHYISDDPIHRITELDRLWLWQASLPECVILFADCAWIKEYFTQRAVLVLEEDIQLCPA